MDGARSTKAWHALAQWIDAGAEPRAADAASRDRVDWARIVPFVGMHLACLGVIWVGISPVAVGVAVALYVLRMFAITGFYHR
jgi:stearoyl-CoA desaturase (delta-9 desaturase)